MLLLQTNRCGHAVLVVLRLALASVLLLPITNCMRIHASSFQNNSVMHKGVSSVFPRDTEDWERVETHQVVFEEIGRCYDPDVDWSGVTHPVEDVPWENDFDKAVKASRLLSEQMPHSQLLHRPLTTAVKKVGLFARMLPHHQAVSLTTDRLKIVPEGQSWADSHCFAFDYSKDNVEDPHGCGFFRKSFQPLQKLRRCILERLDKSSEWKAYAAMSRNVVAGRSKAAREVDNPLEVEDYDEDLLNGTDIVKYTFDGIRRADEMIKYVAFKDWQSIGTGIINEVERKIAETIITADDSALLEEEIVSNIRSDCFLVKADTWEGISQPAKSLKRSLPCYQLMWDQVEVSGGREKPLSNAITMWDESLRYPSQTLTDFATPPVCSRAAVALIAERTKNAPEKFSNTACLTKGEKSWYKCLHPRHFNCICFGHCYKRALEKMCEVNSGCCPTESMPVISAGLETAI